MRDLLYWSAVTAFLTSITAGFMILALVVFPTFKVIVSTIGFGTLVAVSFLGGKLT